MRAVGALLRKDLRLELRAPESVPAIEAHVRALAGKAEGVLR